MNAGEAKINLFGYSDYRRFLRDWYKAKKTTRAGVSYRSFAKRAGLKSVNFFKFVMEGKRNLTEESIVKFATGLKLNKQETEFFRNLVYFNQAKTHEKKNFYYKLLLQSKKLNQLRPIDKHHYEYYSTWYHPVVRELIVSENYDGTPEWLAQKISPAISVDEAAKSILLLEKLGFIQKQKNGRWQHAQTVVTTGPEAQSLILHNYHQNLLNLAKEQLLKVPARQRDVSAITLSVAEDKVGLLKDKIHTFQNEVLKLISEDNEPDRVVALTIQLFPLSEKLREDSQ